MFTRNFNVLLSGVFVKSFGMGIYAAAGMMLVLYLTGNPFYSGVAFFVTTLPGVIGFLISPFANYVNKKSALIICEIIKAALLFSVPLLHMTNMLSVFYVIAVMFILSLIAQFTYPIDSTLLPGIVGEENIVRANSLVQMIRESMDVVFLAVAGFIITTIGSAEALIITGACHLLAACVYTLYRLPKKQLKDKNPALVILLKQYGHDLKEGLLYVRQTFLFHIVVSASFVNFFGGVLFAALPAFTLAQGGTDAFYGYYLMAGAAGMLIGSLIAPKVKMFRYGHLVIICCFISAGAWVGAGLTSVAVSMLLYGIAFIATGVINILLFSLIQQKVETTLIGRVITVMSSGASLCLPLGSLLGGAIAATFSPALAIVIGGGAMAVFALYWLVFPRLRRLAAIDDIILKPAEVGSAS
ncbi:MFS transporter [Shouchella lonarensis]|uniref:Transmembrane secretion effector n=1 Tax=Shouchella lonarensis TaxID=1464122 RepID=A0A1G6GP87_9BACI|nr:MFS transporter [Shouchella lonarensis]SDB83822.1 Transmembrane secretion effector [Shouchella lonarensis]